MTKKTKINTKLMKYLNLNIKYTDIKNKEAFHFHQTLGYFDYLVLLCDYYETISSHKVT